MTWDESTARVLGLIYDSVDADQGWMPLLEVLSDHSHATGAHIFLQDQGTGEFVEDCIVGADEDGQEGYQRLAHTDPSRPLSAQNPGEIINDVDFFSDAFFENTPLYNEVMKAQDARYRVTSVLPLDDALVAGFAVIRSKSMGGFEQAHVERLSHLLPHMVRVLRMQRRLRRLERDAHDVVTALDRLPAAALVVTASLKVVCLNRQAEDLLATTHCLRMRRGELVPKRAGEANALRKAVQDAIALADSTTDGAVSPPQVVDLCRREELPLEVLAVPLRPRYRLRQETHHKARVLLLIYDPAARRSVDSLLVERLFDLTNTEAFVAARLAEGRSIAEVAQERRCAEATVRTHVKRIFTKTGTSRQGELVQLLLTSPALAFGD